MKVTIYGHQRCVWCKRAKERALEVGADVSWMDTDKPEVLEDLKFHLPEVRTVPQIWVDGEHVGGHDEFVALVKDK